MTWIDLGVADGLATITLQNESRRNAINVDLADELVRACAEVDADRTVGAVVLRGAGGFFCSGGDRDELAEICADPTSPEHIDMTSRIYAAFLRVGELAPPTIAAVRGGALGAGINLALATDVRVVARDAVVASGFTRLGVHPGGGHYALLSRAMGAEAAAALGLLGHSVTGERAAELGFAWEACADGDVEDRAFELARHAAADPDLSRAAKASFLAETGPPALPWKAAVQVERAPQMWSFARKGKSGWERPETPTA